MSVTIGKPHNNRSIYNNWYYSVYNDEEMQKVRLWNELQRNHHPELPPRHEFLLMPLGEIKTRFDFNKKFPQNSVAYSHKEYIYEHYGFGKRKRLRQQKKNPKTNDNIFKHLEPGYTSHSNNKKPKKKYKNFFKFKRKNKR